MKEMNSTSFTIQRNPRGGYDVFVNKSGKDVFWETADSVTEARMDILKEFGVDVWPS